MRAPGGSRLKGPDKSEAVRAFRRAEAAGFLLTFGCDLDEYQRVFGNPITVIEGGLIPRGGHGLLLNASGRETFYKSEGYWITPEGAEPVASNMPEEARGELAGLEIKRELSLEGFGEPGSTNMSLPVRGIYRFKSLNAMMQGVAVMDIESFRTLFGYFTAAEITETLGEREEALLATSEDEFLSGDIYASSLTSRVSDLERDLRVRGGESPKPSLDKASYNYVSVILRQGEDLKKSIESLEKAVKDEGLPVKVLSWQQASGQVAQLAGIVQSILGIFVFLLFFVAIVIIMNTLAMNALERTEELGMMRAIGARKGFILKMFLSETFILAFLFGGAGIFAGVIVTWIIRFLRIGSGGNEILELLFGGEVFAPILGAGGLICGIFYLATVTFFAVLYPLLVARKIKPLDAINRQ